MKQTPRSSIAFLSAAVVALTACGEQTMEPATPSSPALSASVGPVKADLASIGEAVFFDKNLSINRNQACATCHQPDFGFASSSEDVNLHGAVIGGSIPGRIGKRKVPSAAYAAHSPVLAFDEEDGGYIGGNFWDGRATGERLGNPSAEQSQFPFVSPTEQGFPDVACVIYRISVSRYVQTYVAQFGNSIGGISFPGNTNQLCGAEGNTIPLTPADRQQVSTEFDRVALAIAAFELSPKVSPFRSKFDAWKQGRATLTPQEQRGFVLYEGKANCAACHPSAGDRPLLTDFTYDNIGVPANPDNPQLIATGFVDLGLGGFLHDDAFNGAQKVPTLRNLDQRPDPRFVKAYMHNGVFKNILQVVHFYNTRDVLPACPAGVGPSDSRFGTTCWPPPEVAENVNRDELGNLHMSRAEELDLVAFLKTLTDKPYY